MHPRKELALTTAAGEATNLTCFGEIRIVIASGRRPVSSILPLHIVNTEEQERV